MRQRLFRIFCVTSRRLCPGYFLEQLARIAQAGPRAIILREKDLNDEDYAALAIRALQICRLYGTPLILSGHPALAQRLGCGVQLPFAHAMQNPGVPVAGVSIHSVEEAALLQTRALSYLVAGHIWPTDCKSGLAARGLEFLHEVCRAASQPVYAIGGVTPERMPQLLAAGAMGACIMSSVMTARDPADYLQKFAPYH